MRKPAFNFNLPVTILREKDRFVAYSPAIDLTTSGKTYQEAQKRFKEALLIFFEELIDKGTIDEVLGELGWQNIKREWQPPVVVARKFESLSIPVKV